MREECFCHVALHSSAVLPWFNNEMIRTMFRVKRKQKPRQHFSSIFKLVFSAGMTGLALLFSIASTFLKLPFFSQLSLTFDFSLVFYLPIIFVCSLSWALLSSLTVSILNFAWNASNWIGILFLICVNLFCLLVFTGIVKIINIHKKIRKKKIKWLISWIILIIFCIVFYSLINGLFFTPLYWWWYTGGQLFTPNFLEVQAIYNSNKIPGLHVYLLGINDYWTGIWSLYPLFNFIKFSASAFVSIPVMFYFQSDSFTAHLFN